MVFFHFIYVIKLYHGTYSLQSLIRSIKFFFFFLINCKILLEIGTKYKEYLTHNFRKVQRAPDPQKNKPPNQELRQRKLFENHSKYIQDPPFNLIRNHLQEVYLMASTISSTSGFFEVKIISFQTLKTPKL